MKEVPFLNVGLGIVLVPIAIVLISPTIFYYKKNKYLWYGLLIAGCLTSLIVILLLTGIYDPYSNHI